MARLTASIAAGATALAVLALIPNGWDADRTDAVRQAVLEAALEHPDGPRNDPDRVICVEVWSGPIWMNRPGESQDPSSALLTRLQQLRNLARPQSECEVSDRGVVHRPTGRRAVIIGVARPEWVSRDFVRVQGGWFYNGLNAVGWRYTASFHNGFWSVDTETFLWVS